MRDPAYAQGPSEAALLGETIGRPWDRVVAEHGDRPALVSRHQGIGWTYSELGERVDCCARARLAAGVSKGDRVGLAIALKRWRPSLNN